MALVMVEKSTAEGTAVLPMAMVTAEAAKAGRVVDEWQWRVQPFFVLGCTCAHQSNRTMLSRNVMLAHCI